MSQHNNKILIVNDHLASVRVLHELLHDEYQIFFATNGTDQIAVMIFTVVAPTRRPDSRIQVAIIKS